MTWKVIVTDRFSGEFGKYKKNGAFVKALDKKIQKLKEDPHIGGELSKGLHGLRSTRILGKFRLIFEIDEKSNKVYLKAIDHRRFDYKRF